MRHSRLWLICAALLVCAVSAAAQKPDASRAGAAIVGKVRPIGQELLLLQPAHASSREAVSRKMRALLEIVHRNPAFSPPVGLDIAPGLLARTPLIGVNRDVVQYEVDQGLLWYVIVRGSEILPEFVSARGFHLHANHISFMFDASEAWVEDRTKQTYWEPRQIGQEAGNPYYHTHQMVMKKIDRPLWIPLTKQQVLAQMLANAKKGEAELPPEAEGRVREMAKQDVACFEAALAGLTTAERSEPAYVSPLLPRLSKCSPLVDAGTPQARRLVVENPAFYDRTVAPSEIQMIVLSFPSFPPQWWQQAVIEKLRKEMDYAALAAMITGR